VKDCLIVTVTGGRAYESTLADMARFMAIISGRSRSVVVRCGGAKGLDEQIYDLVGLIDPSRNIRRELWRADWDRFGRRKAGPIRNRGMLRGDTSTIVRQCVGGIATANKPADLLVSFPGGSGTRDCTGAAGALGIPIKIMY